MFAIAFFKTKQHVKLKVNLLRDISAWMLLLAEAVIAMKEAPMYYIYEAVITLLILFTYFNEVKKAVGDILGKLKK